MTHKKSFFAELIERRVPQILGMYIAAVWLAVEVSEWMIERFDVADQTSSYVAVVMISFLPLIGLLAWGHGRPGKDKWTQKQLLFIPFNVLIAWFAVVSLIKPAVQATEMMSLMDEQTGQMVEYEVAKSELNQKVAGFFWENQTGDASLDWLSYGSMWLVAKDLLRSPIITIHTPYDSPSMLSAVRNRGYENAIGEPLSLDLSIAADRDAKWMIKGRITQEKGETSFEATLYDVVTGALVKSITSTHVNWLLALDDVAGKLGEVILQKANLKPSLIPDLSISEHVSNDLSAIHEVIKSMNAVTFDNDFNEGVAHLKSALAVDHELAEAYLLLIDYYRGIGDFSAAKSAAEAALKLDYKLYQGAIFKVKTNFYAVNGEQEKAIKVLENWVKLYPESADALQALGSNYMIIGNRLDEALRIFEKLNDLQDAGSISWINQAGIYRLKGDKESAISILKKYQNKYPDRAQPYLEMAATYLQFGEIQQAKEMYEEGSLVSTNSIDADLGLAKIMSMEGGVDKSLLALDKLLEKAETDRDKVKVLTEKEIVLYQSGRLHEAMEVLAQMKLASESFMPPLMQTLMYGGKEVVYLNNLQKYDESWALFEEMKANTKPPFDQILSMMETSLHHLQGNDELSASALANFEKFLAEFEMPVYHQIVASFKAVAWRKSGDFDQAIKLHDQAITESKQSILTLSSLHILDEMNYQKAITLYESEQYNASIELLDEVLMRNPLYAQCLVVKAKNLIALGDQEDAMKVMEQAQNIWQNADADFIDNNELLDLKQALVEQ